MSDTDLLAIMAAIIHAGADDSEKASGYSPQGCVKKAMEILREAKAAGTTLNPTR